MEKFKLAIELQDDTRDENTEAGSTRATQVNEIRTLSELELMVASGGEDIVCW